MRLIYWYAECLDDDNVYSIRTKTKRDCIECREERGAERFAPPVKVVMEYADGFDLMEQLKSDCGRIVGEEYYDSPEAHARHEYMKKHDPEYAARIAKYEESE